MNPDLYKLSIYENMLTIIVAVLCVGTIAITTGSMHCLWGLLVLINLNTFKSK